MEKANQSIEGATNMQGRKNFIFADIINLTKPRILRNAEFSTILTIVGFWVRKLTILGFLANFTMGK